jgi:photosystem II stability/assembly factor-like uncharacterized protein
VGGFARRHVLVVRIYATDDGGRHWSRRQQMQLPWRHRQVPYAWLSSPAPDVAWVGAFGTPVIAVTKDGGRTWSRHTLQIGGASAIGQLDALDARTALVQTFAGGHVRTFVSHDGGVTWSRAPV